MYTRGRCLCATSQTKQCHIASHLILQNEMVVKLSRTACLSSIYDCTPPPLKKVITEKTTEKGENVFFMPFSVSRFLLQKRSGSKSACHYTVHCSQSPPRHPIAERCQDIKRGGIAERGNDEFCNKTQRERERGGGAPQLTLKATPFQNS